MNYICIYTDFTKTLRLDMQIFIDFWLIFHGFCTRITNLMQCVLQYNFFSRNQNCCNIIPWASNKENLESIFFGFCPNLFWYCKRKKNMYLINETTHYFRLPNIMLKMTFRKWNWPRLKLLCLSNTILNWTKTDFAFLVYS